MRLFIEGSSHRPTVLFDLEKRFLRIDGMSSMPDSAQFYRELLDWLMTHKDKISPGTQLTFRLLYLNSGTHKALLHFFNQIVEAGLPVLVVFLRAERFDNSEEVELLSQICKQVGLPCLTQNEAEGYEPPSS